MTSKKRKNLGGKPNDGRDFEQAVSEYYESLGFSLIRNARLANQEIDILATRHVEGLGTVRVFIECKDWGRPLGNQEVQKFVTTFDYLRIAHVAERGVLFSRSGYTADGKGAAANVNFVELRDSGALVNDTLTERPSLEALVESYSNSPISDIYVPIDGSTGQSDTIPDVASNIRQAILARQVQTYLITADFGSGKTTLLRRLQFEVAKANLDSRTDLCPLFVSLKDYHDVRDIVILLKNCIHYQYGADLSDGALWSRINSGIYVLLLDGFDEMTSRSSEEQRIDLLRALSPLLSSRCPIVLTSRPSYFSSPGEVERVMATWGRQAAATESYSGRGVHGPKVDSVRASIGARLQRRDDASVPLKSAPFRRPERIDLLPLSAEKIRQFVELRISSEAEENPAARSVTTEDVVRLIQKVYDLRDLANRPILLDMIMLTIFLGELDVSDDRQNLSASSLYRLYTDAKFDNDWDKGEVRRGGLTRDERRRFTWMVALAMEREGSSRVQIGTVRKALPKQWTTLTATKRTLSDEEVLSDFLTCSFMTIDSSYNCTFAHKSFQEYFLAEYVVQYIDDNPIPILHMPLSNAVLQFIGQFQLSDPRVSLSLRQVLEYAPRSERELRKNALTAYLFGVEVAPLTVHDVKLSNLKIGSIELPEWRTVGVTWETSSCERLVLKGGHWLRCKFRSSSIDSVIATDVVLDLKAEDSRISSLKLENSWVSLAPQEPSTISSIEAKTSVLSLPSSMLTSISKVTASVVHLDGQEVELTASGLSKLTEGSILVAPRAHLASHVMRDPMLKQTGIGVVSGFKGDLSNLTAFACWGVLVALDRDTRSLLEGAKYLKLQDDLILCSSDWFAAASKSRGMLAMFAPARLRRLPPNTFSIVGHIQALRTELAALAES